MLLGLSVPVIWGAGFVFAKAGLDQFPPILLMALRFTLAAAVLVWFVKPPWGQLWRICLIALVSAAIQYSLTFTGLKGLDASTAILVVQLEVPFAALLAAIFLKDRLGWQRFFGMVLAFIGVGLIAGQPQNQQNLGPLLLVVGGGFAWSAGQVMIKTLNPVGGLTLIAWVAVWAAPQLFVCSFIFEDDQLQAIRNADAVGWGVVIYLGLIMTALGYTIWYHLLTKHDVNQVMPFLLLLPVTTVIGSVLVLGEKLTLTVVGGGIVAIVGVAIILTYKKTAATQSAGVSA